MIKRYNNDTARLRKGQQALSPMLSFTAHGGVVRLNRRLSELLQVQPGDKVEVMHDEDAGEWYIAKSEGGMFLSNAGRGATQFHSRLLMEAIKAYLPETATKAHACPVATIANTLEGIECFAILGLQQP
jgi:hypothetical protein